MSVDSKLWKLYQEQEVTIARLQAEIAGYRQLEAENARLREALDRLAFAAERRDTTMGDPCRLIEVKAELAAAAKQARAALQPVDLAEPQEADHA